jgi:hypothetical protein
VTQDIQAGVLLAAHGLAAVLLVLLLAARAHAYPATRLRTALGVGVMAAAGAAIFARVHPASLSPDWIDVLHEGNSLRVIRNLHGAQAHAGPGYRALMEALAASDQLDIRDVVRANLWLAVVAATLLWGIARERSRRGAAAWIATALFLLNPLAVNAALSELPSMLLAVELLAAVVAVVVALDEEPALLWARPVAVAELVVVGAIAATARSEMLLLYAPVAAALAAHLLGGPERVRRVDDALRAAVHRALVSSRARTLVFAAMLLAIPLAGMLPAPLGWMLAWANPLEPRVLALPLTLSECLPWGVIALAVLGGARMARRPVRWLLIPWVVIGLARLYARASHGAGFEMLRYASMLLAPVVLLAVEGWGALEALAAGRCWPDGWRALAGVGLAASCLMPPGIGTSQAWPDEAFPDLREGAHALLFHRSAQVELRWLMRRVDAEPRCAFIARVAAEGRYDPRGPRWSWVVFGHGAPGMVEVPFDGSAAEVLRKAAPDATCARFYRSADCELPGMNGCATEIGDARVLDEARLTVLPYSDPGEYGQLPPIVTLGVYEVPLPPPEDRSRRDATDRGPVDDSCDAVSAWATRASRRLGVELVPLACPVGRVRFKLAGAGCDFEVTRGTGFKLTADGAFGVSPIADLDWNTAPAPMGRGLASLISALERDPSLPIASEARWQRSAAPRSGLGARRYPIATGTGVAALCAGALWLWRRRRRMTAARVPPAPP